MYHGEAAAGAARQHFEQTIIRKEAPEQKVDYCPVATAEAQIALVELIHQSGLARSNSDAQRLIMQHAVSIDGHRATDPFSTIDLAQQTPFVLKVGKCRFARIVWPQQG
jgi:tyrosyl-tRNA synthetase